MKCSSLLQHSHYLMVLRSYVFSERNTEAYCVALTRDTSTSHDDEHSTGNDVTTTSRTTTLSTDATGSLTFEKKIENIVDKIIKNMAINLDKVMGKLCHYRK